MADMNFTVLDLVDIELHGHDSLDLRCLGGRKGLLRHIEKANVSRPGLALSGYFDSFAWDRVQVFGQCETAYIQKLEAEGKDETIRELFTYKFPCCIFTHNNAPTRTLFEEAEAEGCPILQTSLESTEFCIRLLRILSDVFAPRKSTHGTLVEVYGLGVLITGESGVGKSEIALELVRRGHRLVADDMVDIRRVSGNLLIGRGLNKIIGHHMEIRGLGIINIATLFGVGAIRERKQIQLVTEIKEWNPSENYDRLGMEQQYENILEVLVPKMEIPIREMRNVAVVIETAAMNERLKMMGYNSAEEFNQNILKWLEANQTRSVYFGGQDL
jgi:HPr kinase/phosphorylase